jgi:hypothetical protein
MKNSNIPNHIASMAKTIVHINRMASLKEDGFTEQNHIARYKRKLAESKIATTLRNKKTFREFAERCVGLA